MVIIFAWIGYNQKEEWMGAVILLGGMIVFGIWFHFYVKSHPKHQSH
jgi:hypothetical protein